MVHNLLLNGNHLLVNEGVLLLHRLLLLNHLLVRLVVVVVLLLGRGLLEVGLRRQLELSLAHGHLGGLNLLHFRLLLKGCSALGIVLAHLSGDHHLLLLL